MSITVHRLNADTTFLFTFSTNDHTRIRVLLDPWLIGDSSWLHPSFQTSKHTVQPSIDSLEGLREEIDAIIVSQDKPDHCHKATLCSWPRDKPIRIFATPTAVKKIREWKHFKPEWIHELAVYTSGESIQRIRVGSGELMIANLASRKDLTGLHNAIAFTFRYSRESAFNMSTTTLDAALHTPPESPTFLRPPLQAPQTLRARIRSYSSLKSVTRRSRNQIASPPQTPDDDEPCVSCIYTPHGVPATIIEPYLRNHLANALPLTLLVHSTVMEKNPWFMGGVVAAGTPGGIEIVKLLQGRVKNWIAAHDEMKDNTGISVKLLSTRRYEDEEVHALLKEEGFDVNLAHLESGKSLTFKG